MKKEKQKIDFAQKYVNENLRVIIILLITGFDDQLVKVLDINVL